MECNTCANRPKCPWRKSECVDLGYKHWRPMRDCHLNPEDEPEPKTVSIDVHLYADETEVGDIRKAIGRALSELAYSIRVQRCEEA